MDSWICLLTVARGTSGVYSTVVAVCSETYAKLTWGPLLVELLSFSFAFERSAWPVLPFVRWILWNDNGGGALCANLNEEISTNTPVSPVLSFWLNKTKRWVGLRELTEWRLQYITVQCSVTDALSASNRVSKSLI